MPVKKSSVAIPLGVVLLLSVVAHSKFIWWKADSKAPFTYLQTVSAGDSLHIWAAGVPGTLIRTSDGGISWSVKTFGASFNDIDFIDSLKGWGVIGSEDGAIFHTLDAGQTWVTQKSSTGIGLRAIQFINLSHGVAVGGRGSYALITSNGGLTWRNGFYPLSNVFMFALKILDTNHVWVAGIGDPVNDTSVVFFSSDWGRSWQAQTLHDDFSPSYVYAIDFIDTLNGWALSRDTDANHLYRTSSGGRSWSRIWELTNFSNWNIQDMDVVDSSHIWMAGRLFRGGMGDIAGFLHSTDGGITWDSVLTETSSELLLDVEMFDTTRGWATGNEGAVFVYMQLILGDLNLDKEVTSADVVLELTKVFLDQSFLAPPEAGDVNCDSVFTPSDVVLILRHAFVGEAFPCSI